MMIKKDEFQRLLDKRNVTIKALKKKLKKQGPSEVTKARQETGSVQDALAKMSIEKTNLADENLRLTELISQLNNSQMSSGNRAYGWEIKAKAYLAAHKNIVDALYEDICGIGK
jgi:hypothetical protein